MTDDGSRQRRKGPLSTMLTTGEVARVFNVCTSTIRRWSAQGLIKAYRIGPHGQRRFRREDVAALYLEKAIGGYLRQITISKREDR